MRVRIRKPFTPRGRTWKHARLVCRLDPQMGRKDSGSSIRIAVYRDGLDAPMVEDVTADSLTELLGRASIRTYALAQELGGRIAHAAIREIVENLVHAGCAGATISILDRGHRIVVSDQGRGIPDKERCMLPGFTTAVPWMRQYIKGVGSGFVVASESMGRLRGSVRVEDNLGRGAVVTLLEPAEAQLEVPAVSSSGPPAPLRAGFHLKERQKRALLVLAESQHAGPSVLAKELGVSLATAHREMGRLETMGLVQYVGKGKRMLTEEGLELVRSFTGT